MNVWDASIVAISKGKNSPEFLAFCKLLGENPMLTSDPHEYNDPIGRTEYYKFLQSGVEVGFRNKKINHIHFYLENTDGYTAFNGKLCYGLDKAAADKDIMSFWGLPEASGGGKLDPLIGYVNKWIKYRIGDHLINFQFNKHNYLSRVTIIRS
jgi:filamentous hemagglutinin